MSCEISKGNIWCVLVVFNAFDSDKIRFYHFDEIFWCLEEWYSHLYSHFYSPPRENATRFLSNVEVAKKESLRIMKMVIIRIGARKLQLRPWINIKSPCKFQIWSLADPFQTLEDPFDFLSSFLLLCSSEVDKKTSKSTIIWFLWWSRRGLHITIQTKNCQTRDGSWKVFSSAQDYSLF